MGRAACPLPGRRSTGMFVSIFRVTQGCPTPLPGRLHLACLAFFRAAASLCRSDDQEFVDDGEWGPLWYLSLLASLLLPPSSSSTLASC